MRELDGREGEVQTDLFHHQVCQSRKPHEQEALQRERGKERRWKGKGLKIKKCYI